jgi:DNA polymerase III subunit delta'
MAFKDFSGQLPGIQLLQRSIERGRLGHAYLFAGDQLAELESIARTLAKALNCQQPIKKNGAVVDCCDRCLVCRKIEHANHPDIHWVRPESKTRIIRIEQIRGLIEELNLKPTEAQFKVGIVVAADRLKMEAANAFLKTLEEPPPNSILILLTTEPQRILETIVSRCLRLNFGCSGARQLPRDQIDWLGAFADMAAAEQKSLLGRYRLMDVFLGKLNQTRAGIEQSLTARSPLQQYKDAEKEWVDKWEDELAAAIEAEYRRQRAELIGVLQWWLRDVWLRTLQMTNGEGKLSHKTEPASPGNEAGELLSFPEIDGSARVAQRISSHDALGNLQVIEQLQRWLGTNVQEALALEVSLLKLRL